MKPKKLLSNAAKTLVIPVAVYLVFLLLTQFTGGSAFGAWSSINIILQQSVMTAMVGWAMSFNMVNGRWDFSVGAMVLITAILGASIALKLGWGAAGILVCCVAVGLALSVLTGLVQRLIGAPSLVTSFGVLMVYEALQAVVNDAQGVRIMGATFTKLGMYPYVFLLGIAVALLHYFLYEHTLFGYHVRALGYNASVAKSIGLDGGKNAFGCFLACGFFAGIAAVVYVSFKGSVQLSMDMGSTSLVFESMIPVFIGIFLAKYSNLTIGVYVGAVSTKMLVAGLLAVGLSSTLQSVANGVFLFVIIAFSVNESRVRQWYAARKKIRAQAAA